MQVIAVGNQKGGVGKTTTAFTLACVAAKSGARTLMVDMDAQGSLTVVASGHAAHNVTLSNVLGGATPALGMAKVVQRIGDNLELAPGGAPLVSAEVSLTSKVGRESYLKRALSQCPDRWDMVFIDTPPTCSLMTVNALVAAQTVLIPTQAQALDLDGLQNFRCTIAEVQEMANPRLKIAGIVLTFFENRFIEHRNAMQQIVDANLPLCKTTIGRSVRIAESSRHCRAITDFAVDNPQAAAYEALARELDIIKEGQTHAQRTA